MVLVVVGIGLFGARWLSGHRMGPFEPTKPVIDASTAGLIDSGTRVETYRLADFHEMEMQPDTVREAMEKHPQLLDNYSVTRRGPTLDGAFAHRLARALASGRTSTSSFVPSCFDPGVGFRAWHGKDYTTVVICFHCLGVKIGGVTNGKPIAETFSELGTARDDLLGLSLEAFPDDKILKGLRDGTVR